MKVKVKESKGNFVIFDIAIHCAAAVSYKLLNMKVLLFMSILYRTNNMQLTILLLMSPLVSLVATFELFDRVKDAINYEHCGSVWIDPDVAGNNYDNY